MRWPAKLRPHMVLPSAPMTVPFLKAMASFAEAASPGSAAKASAMREGASDDAKARGAPPVAAGAAVCGMDAVTSRVKSVRARPCIANPVGSTETIRSPETTKGTLPLTLTPASDVKVRFWLPVFIATALLVPPRLIPPMMIEPGNSVSVGLLPDMSMARGPVVLVMKPELTRLLLPVPWVDTCAPRQIEPELATVVVPSP